MAFPWEKKKTLTVDLHQMTTSEAKQWLTMKVTAAPKNTEEIEVIHGYRGGTALGQMVRKSFRHPRVRSVVLGLNPGTTILILK